MSRRPRAIVVALLLVLAPASHAIAQEPAPASAAPTPSRSAEEALADAEEAYGPPDTRSQRACPTASVGGEIVVCGKVDTRDYSVQSSSELDPTGKGARDIVPRAPEVGTAYPGVVVATGCFIPPCPPKMPVLIDLKAIPEAPPGSDADRVAQGLAPRGGSGGVPRPPASAPARAGTLPEATAAAALSSEESASPAAPPSG